MELFRTCACSRSPRRSRWDSSRLPASDVLARSALDIFSGKGALRVAKGYTRGYSATQVSLGLSSSAGRARELTVVPPTMPPPSALPCPSSLRPQIKVRDATCNQAWGPSGAEMSEIAQLTYNQ